MKMVWLIDVIDLCQVIYWLMIVLDENDRCQSGNQLIKIDHWYDVYDAVVNLCKDESLLSYHDW